jgi:hypothetical protein
MPELFLEVLIEDFLIRTVGLKIGKAVIEHLEKFGILALLHGEAVG